MIRHSHGHSYFAGQFIKKYHYSGSLPRGCNHVFELWEDGRLMGVASYGIPVGKNCHQKYDLEGNNILELKRLCLVDDAPKNSESKFIAQTLKWLKINTEYSTILSYADPEYGHTGVIYRASNFNYAGLQDGARTKAVEYKGKRIHLRAAYQKLNGIYTTTAKEIKRALKEKRAKLVKIDPKHIYLYRFNRGKKYVFYNKNSQDLYYNYKPSDESHQLIGRF